MCIRDSIVTIYLPFNSDIAIDVNVAIMRAFIALKQFALTNTELNHKLREFENTTTNSLNMFMRLLIIY